MKRLLLFIYSFCQFAVLFSAETYVPLPSNPITESWRWQHISELDGQNIWSVTEDNNGNFWFGYDFGVIKYNGYNFTHFPFNKENNVGYVRQLKVLGNEILVGSYQGVTAYNYTSGQWKNYMKLTDSISDITGIHHLNITDIKILNTGMVIFVTGIGLLTIKNNEKQFYTSNKTIAKLAPFYADIKFVELQWGLLQNTEPKFSNLLVLNGECYLTLGYNGTNNFELYFEINKLGSQHLNIRNCTLSKIPFSIFCDNNTLIGADGNVWISNSCEGLVLTNPGFNQSTMFAFGQNDEEEKNTTQPVQYTNYSVLIGGKGCIYQASKDKLVKFQKPEIPVSKTSVIKLYKDTHGNLWVINIRNKIYRVELGTNRWQVYPNLVFQLKTKGNESWYISNDYKIVRNKDSVWTSFSTTDGLISNPKKLIQTTKGHFWCGGSHNGKAATAYFDGNRWHKQIHALGWSISSKAIFEDTKGNIWFGAAPKDKYYGPGILKLTYKRISGPHFQIFPYPFNSQSNIVEFKGELLSSTSARVHRTTDTSDHFNYLGVGSAMSSLAVHNDSVLVCGSPGKGIYIKLNNAITHYTISDGLKSTVIHNVSRGKGGFYIATEEDISFLSDNGNFINHCINNKIVLQNEYGFIQPDPVKGLWIVEVSTDWILEHNKGVVPSVRSIRYIADTNAPKTIFAIMPDTVSEKGNVFIAWKGLDMWETTPSQHLLYTYKLDNENWSPYTSKTNITLLSLKPGHHTFSVKAIDTDLNKQSIPATVTFMVLPPLYIRGWFVLMVFCFIGIVIYLISRILIRNKKLAKLNTSLNNAYIKLDDQQKEILKRKEEAHNAKLRFFTNISHEFRTPLTFIISPLEELKEKSNNVATRYSLNLALKYAQRLLNLIDQLIMFRRVESGVDKLKLTYLDINEMIKGVCESFIIPAKKQNIQFSIEIPTTKNMVWADVQKLETILYNLLSNAFKSIKESRSVTVKVFGKNDLKLGDIAGPNSYSISGNKGFVPDFSIKVSDTGIGISKESLPNIFERFYNVNSENHVGYGIGLALVKNLVLLMKGTIHVKSEKNRGSEFMLSFMSNQPTSDNDIIDSHKFEQPGYTNDIIFDEPELFQQELLSILEFPKYKNTILIVEDNKEMRDYLLLKLSEFFNVFTAENGKQAWGILQKEEVELVLSDVLMPVMDGFELCGKIKEDFSTCHIPVVMLTAKTGHGDKVKSVLIGADDYISKPFSIKYVVIKIQTTLKNKELIIEKASKSSLSKLKEITTKKVEQSFIDKVVESVKGKMTEEDFNVGLVINDLGFSRSVFYNKVKEISELAPAEFLKQVRMSLGIQHLVSNGRINEAASHIGMTPSNFAREFKRIYKKTPSEFLKSV